MSTDQQILKDSFGRVHDYLRISLTERCNLRCFYCMPEEGVVLRDKAEFMTSEEVIEIASVFVGLGINKIRLTGGEPLIKKDISNVMRQLGSLPVKMNMTTNGILVDRHIEDFKAANINSLNISFDSLNEDKFNRITRRNSFEKIVQNINLLEKEGFQIKINVVLMRGENDDEILDFIHWTKNHAFDIRFIEFMPFSGNNWNINRKISHEEVLHVIADEFGSPQVKQIKAKPHDTAVNYRVDGHLGTFGLISSVTQPFCAGCNRIRLTADGKIKNCLFSTDELDLLTPLRQGKDIENLIRQSILEKHEERGGIDDFDTFESHQNNRSMITIGG